MRLRSGKFLALHGQKRSHSVLLGDSDDEQVAEGTAESAAWEPALLQSRPLPPEPPAWAPALTQPPPLPSVHSSLASSHRTILRLKEEMAKMDSTADAWESSLLPPAREAILHAERLTSGKLLRRASSTSLSEDRTTRASVKEPDKENGLVSAAAELLNPSLQKAADPSVVERLEGLKARAARAIHEATESQSQHGDEDSWELSLLPERRALLPKNVHSTASSDVVDDVGEAANPGALLSSPPVASAEASPPVASPPAAAADDEFHCAPLISLDLTDFKCFKEKSMRFEKRSFLCIVGPNSSGKSSILDAIKFVTMHSSCRSNLKRFVRRCRPAVLKCSVIAAFDVSFVGKVKLCRQVELDVPRQESLCHYALSIRGAPFKSVSEAEYIAYVKKLLCWSTNSVIMSQFDFLQRSDVMKLLQRLPETLDRLEANASMEPPSLKRRIEGKSFIPLSKARPNLIARVGRRLDEIYKELSRGALDENFTTWGEGGQAFLRQIDDDLFTIYVSQKRGLAALGFGSPLESISQGDKDLCALALLLTLPGLSSDSLKMQETLPPLVILDEPDSRLDKRAACCLQRLLSGADGPAQCFLTSLNNHQAFVEGVKTIVLPELPCHEVIPSNEDGDDDPYGDKVSSSY